jgi:hypothetical protein
MFVLEFWGEREGESKIEIKRLGKSLIEIFF